MRRLDAEAVYDSILSLSGSLDSTIGGPTVREGTKSEYGYEFEVGRRAMYMPVFGDFTEVTYTYFGFVYPTLSAGAFGVGYINYGTTFEAADDLCMHGSPWPVPRARRPSGWPRRSPRQRRRASRH